MKLFLASKQPGKSCILALLALALTACGGGDGDDAAPNDTSAPVLSELTAVGAHTSDNTPHYVFRSTEAGRISYSGGCEPTGLTAFAGNNTATFRALIDGTYDSCRITVTDAAGNESDSLSVTSFTVDTVAPTLIEQTSVTTPARNHTPVYVFSVFSSDEDDEDDEAGTITYGGACSADVANAVSGQNQITFNALDDGTYRNCTITVTDLAGNASTLAVREFTVDNVAPVLVERTPVSILTRDNTPNYEFSSTEAGAITYGGSCVSTNLSAVRNNNVVTFNTLTDGTYNDCTITVTDVAGNASLALSVSPFTVNTAVPTLQHVTAVPSPTNDNTPNYTFSSSSAGRISFVNGSCRSATTTAVAGNNTLTFNTLSDGIHDCTIRVTDELGNPSNLLTIPAFTIDTTGPTLTQVTPISTHTNNPSPSYRFTSSESSAIVYGGDCAAYNPSAVVDGNAITVSFLNLVDRAYNNCTLTMQDALGNTSTLAIPGFTVDTIVPVLMEVTPVVASSNDITPNYTFSSSEAGTITYGGSCASAITSAVIGNNAITFNALTHGAYSNCTIRVTDAAGNVSSLLNITAFEVITDVTAPVVSEVTPVTSGNDITPIYTFNTTEAGTITYGGGCTSATTSATTGPNTITFNLAVGFYQDCTLTVTDVAGLVSNTLDISAFLIGKPLNDAGITLCGDYAYDDISSGYDGSDEHNNSIDCASEASPSSTTTQEGFEVANGNDVVPSGQDAVYGRDSNDATNDDDDGHKGFSFTKIGAGGEELASDASSWSCVRDNVTGLIWEVKTDDGGLSDKDWTYTWYNSTGVNDGGDHGVGDTGVGTTTGYEHDVGIYAGTNNCFNASSCDTQKFAADVNEAGLCGASNWRLPTSAELKNLLHLGALNNPAIDTDFFPNTVNRSYWTSSPSALSDNKARVVDFVIGTDSIDDKHVGNYVRLVRSNH